MRSKKDKSLVQSEESSAQNDFEEENEKWNHTFEKCVAILKRIVPHPPGDERTNDDKRNILKQMCKDIVEVALFPQKSIQYIELQSKYQESQKNVDILTEKNSRLPEGFQLLYAKFNPHNSKSEKSLAQQKLSKIDEILTKQIEFQKKLLHNNSPTHYSSNEVHTPERKHHSNRLSRRNKNRYSKSSITHIMLKDKQNVFTNQCIDLIREQHSSSDDETEVDFPPSISYSIRKHSNVSPARETHQSQREADKSSPKEDHSRPNQKQIVKNLEALPFSHAPKSKTKKSNKSYA